jgi:hypothetical protein
VRLSSSWTPGSFFCGDLYRSTDADPQGKNSAIKLVQNHSAIPRGQPGRFGRARRMSSGNVVRRAHPISESITCPNRDSRRATAARTRNLQKNSGQALNSRGGGSPHAPVPVIQSRSKKHHRADRTADKAKSEQSRQIGARDDRHLHCTASNPERGLVLPNCFDMDRERRSQDTRHIR